MSSRCGPYKSTQKTIGNFITNNLMIPMNQREYSWTISEIKQVLDDMHDIFENTSFKELIGSIIVYTNKEHNTPEIYDGQQRTITIILILICIAEISNNNEVYNNIIHELTVNSCLGELSDLQKRIKDDKQFEKITNIKIPKIYCVNPHDNTAIILIFNKQIYNYWHYVENNKLTDGKYICSLCKTSIGEKKDFHRHLRNQHEIYEKNEDNKDNTDNITKNNIYKAYLDIYNTIINFNYDLEKLKGFYRFITKDIEIQHYEVSDSFYVTKIFEWQNNRGKEVHKLDLVKNVLLSSLDDKYKLDIYTLWDNIKTLTHKSMNDYGQRLLDCSIQIYNKNFERNINDSHYKKIIDEGVKNNDICKEIKNFLNIAKKLKDIYKEIEEDRFGKLILNSKCLSWEPFMWCILPTCYEKNNINNDLIKLFVKYYFRNKLYDTATFNSFLKSDPFIKIINIYHTNKDYDYYTDIKTHLIAITDESIKNKNSFIQKINEMSFTNTKFVTLLLMFIETCETTDSHKIDLKYTLEHIYPQKNKDKLKNKNTLNYIGNLTLLEGKNSQNGHQGNFASGSIEYNKKKKSYKNSASKITRDVVEKYNEDTFEESDIIKRTKEYAEKIEKYTRYF
jgi:hypothetical protein